jgi:osmoprotectant transport system permease protein
VNRYVKNLASGGRKPPDSVARSGGLCPPIALVVVAALLLPGCRHRSDDVVRVASKAFPESEILGDIVADVARGAGARVEMRSQLGDTSKTWNGLLVGEIDVYCEYTGTLREEILSGENLPDDAALREALAKRGLRMSRSLGFSNTYAIGMRKKIAEEKHIRTISDLKSHPELKFGVSTAFAERGDGWKSLRARYGLPFAAVRGMDHALVYQALNTGAVDAADVYMTDAGVRQYNLQILDDDLHFFPSYDAVLLYRADLEERAPKVVKALLKLEGTISEDAMREMNTRAQVDHVPEARVAADFLNTKLGYHIQVQDETWYQRVLARTWEHLLLVVVSLVLGVLAAIPLGILAARRRWLGHAILAVVGAVQTIPALALLVLLVVVLKTLGAIPAIIALFCYSLLPIVRNTSTGLHDVAPTVRESADALGLSSFSRLYLIDLPLASRSILAGVKTAAVITVGNATLGGLIGAGGYGLTILIGLNKSDGALLLEGALPAMAMALLVQGLFEVMERFVVPRGLRLAPAR